MRRGVPGVRCPAGVLRAALPHGGRQRDGIVRRLGDVFGADCLLGTARLPVGADLLRLGSQRRAARHDVYDRPDVSEQPSAHRLPDAERLSAAGQRPVRNGFLHCVSLQHLSRSLSRQRRSRWKRRRRWPAGRFLLGLYGGLPRLALLGPARRTPPFADAPARFLLLEDQPPAVLLADERVVGKRRWRRRSARDADGLLGAAHRIKRLLRT